MSTGWIPGGHMAGDYALLRRMVIDGDLLRNIEPLADESAAEQKLRVRASLLMFKEMLHKRASLYRTSPVRSIIDSKDKPIASATADAQARLWGVGDGLSAVLRFCDIEATLAGAALVLLRIMPDGRIESIPVRSDRWEYVDEGPRGLAYGDDLVQPTKVRVHLGPKNWRVYDDETVTAMTPDRKEPSVARHGYSRMPCVVLPNELTFTDVTAPTTGGRDLCKSIHDVQQMYERMQWLGVFQNDQMVAEEGVENLGRSPVRAITGNPAMVDIKPPGSRPDVVHQVVQSMIDAMAIAMGVPKRAFSIRQSAEPVSAAVIAASEIQLKQALIDRQTVARRWERTILQRASLMLKDSRHAPLRTSIKTEYVEAPMPLTYKETESLARVLEELGLASSKTVARLLQPDKTDRELEKQIAEADDELEIKARRVAMKAGHMQDTAPDGIEGSPKQEDQEDGSE